MSCQRPQGVGGQAATEAPPEPGVSVLYDLVDRTYPIHSEYELEHQLMIRSEDPAQVMELLALEPGMVFGDIGCGAGFYTFLAVPAVGASGQVYAIDIQQTAIDYISRRVADPAENPHGNIRVIHSTVDDTRIPDGTLDAALFSHADFYAFTPMLAENERMLASLFRALKPGGAMVVVQDMRATSSSSAGIISANFQAAGFAEETVLDLPGDYDLYMRFRKLSGPSSTAVMPGDDRRQPVADPERPGD